MRFLVLGSLAMTRREKKRGKERDDMDVKLEELVGRKKHWTSENGVVAEICGCKEKVLQKTLKK